MGRNNADFHLSRLGIPAEPSTAPIPEGHVRLFHYTRPDALPSIRTQGLAAQEDGKSARDKEPAMVWANEGEPSGGIDQFDSKPVVEFHIPGKDWEKGAGAGLERSAVWGPISPKNIVAIHEPWHTHIRSMLKMHSPEEIASGALNQYKGQDENVDKAIEALSNGS